MPVEKPEMLISELKVHSINITCSSIGRPTPYLSILIGKEVERDLIRTNQFNSSRGMNKSVIFMKYKPDKYQLNIVTCCSQQMVDIVGYQRNVCSDAREINIECKTKRNVIQMYTILCLMGFTERISTHNGR